MPHKPHKPHTYRGHRAESFVPVDLDELVEVRARHRTFEGAYRRTALSNLGYSLTILRLFDRRFYRIGLLYAVLAALLSVVAFLRNRHSRHDFADRTHNPVHEYLAPLKTVGQDGKPIFGRPFVTAGWIVVSVACIVASVEIGLLALILNM